MTREEKSIAIQELKEQLATSKILYLADISGLDAGVTSDLRRACYKTGVTMSVVKNTLLSKAMDASDLDYGNLTSVLKGNSALMIAEAPNAPAKIIKNFRKGSDRPLLKGAFVNEEIYIGDDQLDTLVAIKSREELIGEVIGLLQSPVQRVISALKNKSEEGSEE